MVKLISNVKKTLLNLFNVVYAVGASLTLARPGHLIAQK